MFYPLVIQQRAVAIRPLFADLLEGRPYLLDLSEPVTGQGKYTTSDFEAFQREIFDEMHGAGARWGIGKYLENRSGLLGEYPDMIRQGRVYHAGLDIIVPAGVPLFAPLEGRVHAAVVDGGIGNYGGVVVLRHQLDDVIFYSLYGHLNTRFEVEAGQTVAAGQRFGTIGEGEDSGGWFTHTHLQILTPLALERGLMLSGYVRGEDLDHVDDIFPSPYPMFCY